MKNWSAIKELCIQCIHILWKLSCAPIIRPRLVAKYRQYRQFSFPDSPIAWTNKRTVTRAFYLFCRPVFGWLFFSVYSEERENNGSLLKSIRVLGQCLLTVHTRSKKAFLFTCHSYLWLREFLIYITTAKNSLEQGNGKRSEWRRAANSNMPTFGRRMPWAGLRKLKVGNCEDQLWGAQRVWTSLTAGRTSKMGNYNRVLPPKPTQQLNSNENWKKKMTFCSEKTPNYNIGSALLKRRMPSWPNWGRKYTNWNVSSSKLHPRQVFCLLFKKTASRAEVSNHEKRWDPAERRREWLWVERVVQRQKRTQRKNWSGIPRTFGECCCCYRFINHPEQFIWFKCLFFSLSWARIEKEILRGNNKRWNAF